MTWLLLLVWTAGAAAIGWPLARSTMSKETRVFVLLAYGVVGGYALLTVLLIVLWGAMPLGPAQYTVMAMAFFAAGLLLRRTSAAQSRAPRSWGMGRADTLLVAAIIAVFAFLAYRLFTVGYSSWDAEALYWHSGLVGWMSRSGFPPTSPFSSSLCWER